VRLKELGSRVTLHPAPMAPIVVGGIEVVAALVIHPGPTVGYRLTEGDRAIAYLPDHEPALGARRFPDAAEWTSGYALASGVDLLIHDAQYTALERSSRIGWGHSSIEEAVAFAASAGASAVVPFHHDPTHSDEELDALFRSASGAQVDLIPAAEGLTLAI
jgi:ribonuclease BN (tRNA processing enzyme)